MPVLDPTVGGANSNSYAPADEAVAYFEARLNVAPWTAIESDDDAVARALITATHRLEQEKYVGAKATSAQALKWPRRDAFDEDGEEIPENVIPVQVRHAMFEQALYMLSQGTTDLNLPTGLEPFKRLKTSTVELEMRSDRAPEEVAGLSPAAVRLLGDLLITYDIGDADLSPGTFRIERA